MTRTELQGLLNTFPPDIEVIVGDPDVGIFFEPHVKSGTTKRVWKLTLENQLGGPPHVSYYDSKSLAERAREDTTLECCGLEEVECVRL